MNLTIDYWLLSRSVKRRLHEIYMRPMYYLHENLLSFMGIQVTTTLDENILNEVDKRANAENLSRAKYLNHIITTWVLHEIDGDAIATSLTDKVAYLEETIEELRRDKAFLQGHVSQLLAEQNRLLPSPKTSLWSRLFTRG